MNEWQGNIILHQLHELMVYFQCQYVEKDKEKRGFVYYKHLKTEVFVLPIHVFLPSVSMDNGYKITCAEYQFKSDCI